MGLETSSKEWNPFTTALTKKDLSSQWLIVHFWASWNKIDYKMDSNLKNVVHQVLNVINFRSVNINNPEFSEFINDSEVGNIPALGFYKSGAHIKTTIGLRSSDEIVQDIRMWVNTGFFSQ